MKLATRKRTFARLLPVVGLLVLYVFSRTYHVLALPPFLDESEQISYAQQALRGQLLSGGGNARLLGSWWVGLFQDSGDPALWLNRIATALIGVISAAVIYSVARRLASARAGIMAVILYILMPFALFHERLGLSDPYASVFGALTIWFALRFAVRGRLLDALLAGLMITLSILGKGTGVMLAIIPAILFALLIPLSSRRKLIHGLIAAYGALAVTWIPFYLYLRSLGQDYFSIPTSYVGTNEVAGVTERLQANLQLWWALDSTYLSPLFVLLAVILGVYLIVRRPRVGVALALIVVLPVLGLLAFGTRLSGRYLLFHLPPLAICMGVGLSVLADDLRRTVRLAPLVAWGVPVVLVAIWAIMVALPFDLAMYSNPGSQRIPDNDQWQYFQADPSGYGINQAADYLIQQQAKQQQPIHVIGLLPNCHGLQNMIPPDSGIVVECPPIPGDPSQQPSAAAFVNQQAFDANTNQLDLWFIYELRPHATLDGIAVPYHEIASFYRPGNISHVTLYHVGTNRQN